MRNRSVTREFYVRQLGFQDIGSAEYQEYLILKKDEIELHFFLFEALNPEENYGQVYIRCADIRNWYQSLLNAQVEIHPNGKLEAKPWGQWEFSILDPDTNLLTFGQAL